MLMERVISCGEMTLASDGSGVVAGLRDIKFLCKYYNVRVMSEVMQVRRWLWEMGHLSDGERTSQQFPRFSNYVETSDL